MKCGQFDFGDEYVLDDEGHRSYVHTGSLVARDTQGEMVRQVFQYVAFDDSGRGRAVFTGFDGRKVTDAFVDSADEAGERFATHRSYW